MEEETFALRDVLRILRHYRWQILAFTLVTVIAAVIITFGQSKRYTAETQLVVGPAVPDAALPDARGNSKTGPLGLDLPAETQARIVASPLMAGRVARALRIPPDAAHIEELTKRVQVKAVTDNVLLITANAPSAVEAAALANGYATEYLRYRRDAAKSAVQALSSDYKRRLDRLQLQADLLAKQIASATADGASGDAARLTSARQAILDELNALTRSSQSLLDLSKTAELGGGQIIAPATRPTGSSSPNPIRNILIGILLGGAAGISVALFREHTYDRIRTRHDAARLAHASVLGAIPRRPPFRASGDELVTLQYAGSVASNAYRELRGNLVRRGLGSQVRCLLVTSVGAGPEAAETVGNLGVACARAGLSTVVMSADLSHPRLHSYFGISGAPGLASVLANGSRVDKSTLTSMLYVVDIPNLFVLPSGVVDSGLGELLESAPLGYIFGVAASVAEVVIVEAPPILNSGDVITLAGYADATLLVVRAGVDKETLTARAASMLEMTGCVVQGVVLHGAWKDDETVGWIEDRPRDLERRPTGVADLRNDLSPIRRAGSRASPSADGRQGAERTGLTINERPQADGR
jgi:Mrp family chromosome partitioning ATPase/capsular polysaccharide biosynthesis protein